MNEDATEFLNKIRNVLVGKGDEYSFELKYSGGSHEPDLILWAFKNSSAQRKLGVAKLTAVGEYLLDSYSVHHFLLFILFKILFWIEIID